MKARTSILISFAFVLMLTPSVFAQRAGHHGGASGAGTGVVRMQPRPAVRMHTAVATTNGVTTNGIGVTTNGITTAGNVIVLSPDSLLTPDALLGGFPTPGLGFDFAHLAAINSGAGVRALIDPVTQHEIALARAIRRETPVFFSTFPGFFPGFFPGTEQVAPQPTIIVVPQAVAPAAEQAAARAPETDTRRAEPPVVEPARDAGDFVLVRRDGVLLFAVAYTQGADRITYITKEGIRRGLALADLDVDATMRMNEERGTPLQFPESFRR